jgi:hypothetical protein
MNIDYVVISSDDNSLYKDFLPIVTKTWNFFGYEVLYLNISDAETDIKKTSYGLIKKINGYNVNTGLKSQIARQYAFRLLPDKNLLISDIDMIPLNIEFFTRNADKIHMDNIGIFHKGNYTDVNYYPMCYVVSKGDVFANELKIEEDFNEFYTRLSYEYKNAWNTDEHYMYDSLKQSSKKIFCSDRHINSTRICRSNWQYDIDLLKKGFYIDSHLLRPFDMYRKQIDTVITLAGIS